MDQPIYLDHNATTPIHPEVREAMLPWLGELWGNPSSAHAYGRRAAEAVAHARMQVAQLIGAQADEIIFTSGGTEADNLALLGTGPFLNGRLLTSTVEHPAVALARAVLTHERDWFFSELPVTQNGAVLVKRAGSRLADPAPHPVDLVSLILAQNETGVIQPVSEITAITRRFCKSALVHSDAAQAVGKIPVNVQEIGVDLLTIVSHKLYGPKGIGALYVRQGVALPRPLRVGGGQEREVCPGTQPVALIVGFGQAAEVAARDLEAEGERLATLRDELAGRLLEAIPGSVWTGQQASLLPNTLHIRLPNCQGADVLAHAPQIAASTGSACHAGTSGTASGVLGAMGLRADECRGSLRLSLGRLTRDYHIGAITRALVPAWQQVAT
ncbi:MAG: cysteine desulfurase family protein [Nannocystaceae bacterium]